MSRTIEVYDDGSTLKPQEPLDLVPQAVYRVTIDEQPLPAEGKPATEAFGRVLEMAEDMGIEDLSEQHDHYLYGTPKR
jgi:hypothetical protein